MSYDTGKQPCDNFQADMDGNGTERWENRHECYAPFDGTRPCDLTVSSCAKCNKDHHEDGYNSCKGRPIPTPSTEDKAL
jgi:hypothetical protein